MPLTDSHGLKVVAITGSTRGLGFGLAKAFLERGCAVTVSGAVYNLEGFGSDGRIMKGMTLYGNLPQRHSTSATCLGRPDAD